MPHWGGGEFVAERTRRRYRAGREFVAGGKKGTGGASFGGASFGGALA